MTDHWTLDQIRMAFYDYMDSDPPYMMDDLLVFNGRVDKEWEEFGKHLKEGSE